MKAIVQTAYGSADVLELREIDKPVVKDEDVLVRVHAAAIHAGDYFAMRGIAVPRAPLHRISQAEEGLRRGTRCRRARRGGRQERDAVPAGRRGVRRTRAAPAPSTPVPSADKFALKPDNLTLRAGCSRARPRHSPPFRALRDAGKVQPGQKVLINGASGGVGTVRRADRQGARSGGDRCVQHEERGDGPIDRRGPRHRLHQGGLHAGWAALRPDPRQRGEPLVLGLQARAHPRGDSRSQQRPRRPGLRHQGVRAVSRSCASRGARSSRRRRPRTWSP